MHRRHPHARALTPAFALVAMACLPACPAAAGDIVQVVPVCSDSRGNQAWIEIGPDGDRMKATPFVAAGGENLGKWLDNPDGKGSLAIPIPRLMRLVERARQALRDAKRPAARAAGATAPPGAQAAAGRGYATPDQTGAAAPHGTADLDIFPPDLLYSSASR